MNDLEISSSERDTVLKLTGLVLQNGELVDYMVSLSQTGMSCKAKVCGYMSGGFAEYFRKLDRSIIEDGGWSGEQSWSSLEGEFDLVATSDSLGHVYLTVTLRSGYYDLDWMVKGGLLLEAQQLSDLAVKATAAVKID